MKKLQQASAEATPQQGSTPSDNGQRRIAVAPDGMVISATSRKEMAEIAASYAQELSRA